MSHQYLPHQEQVAPAPPPESSITTDRGPDVSPPAHRERGRRFAGDNRLQAILDSTVPTVGTLAVIATGYAAGNSLPQASCFTFVFLPFLAGGAFGLVGLFRPAPFGERAWGGRLAGALLIAYVLAAGTCDPLAFVGGERG